MIKSLINIPKKINLEGLVEIRGECSINKKIFLQYQKQKPLKNHMNSRQTVRDILQSEPERQDWCQYIEFGFFEVYSDNFCVNEMDQMLWLMKNGFTIPKFIRCTAKDCAMFYKQILLFKQKMMKGILPFQGIIVKANERMCWSKVHPDSPCKALLYQTLGVQTVVQRITFHIYKTGDIVPIADIHPIRVND